MKRYLITYQTDGNPITRNIISRGKDEREAERRFVNRMKKLNICECQIEIFGIQEL